MIVKNESNRFRVARMNAGYTQRDVQRITGFITFQALSHYENGKSIPSNKVYITLAKLYNVSLDYLLYHDDYRNHNEYLFKALGLTQVSINKLKQLKLKNENIDSLKEFIKQLYESEVI